MHKVELLLVLITGLTLAYDFINGFSDLPHAIATVVSTRIMGLSPAVLLAGLLIFLGAYTSSAVARTLAKGLMHTGAISEPVILAAIVGALAWGLITWWLALPSSSSHALIGGLCGAAMARGGLGAVQWGGLTRRVVIPMIASPLIGVGVAFFLMTAILTLLAHAGRQLWDPAFRFSQIFSAGAVAFAHGSGSGQKGMGILTLALLSQGAIRTPDVPVWVMIACTAAIAAGGATGGMRIIATLGNKIVRLNTVQGFAAQACCASVVYLADFLAMPVSTTQVLSGTIMGVGAAHRPASVRWGIVQKILGAWLVTLPAAGLVAACVHLLLQLAGFR